MQTILQTCLQTCLVAIVVGRIEHLLYLHCLLDILSREASLSPSLCAFCIAQSLQTTTPPCVSCRWSENNLITKAHAVHASLTVRGCRERVPQRNQQGCCLLKDSWREQGGKGPLTRVESKFDKRVESKFDKSAKGSHLGQECKVDHIHCPHTARRADGLGPFFEDR